MNRAGGSGRKHTEYYEFLGVETSASDDDIRRAYKKKSLQFHPDRNPGQEENFKKLQQVYDVLKDKEKREVYDRHGPKGIEEGLHERGASLFDILSGRAPRGGGQGERKGEDFVKKIGVELPHLYKGVSKQLKITKKLLCSTCSGSGAKPGSEARKCSACRGQGQQLRVVQSGFMIQQAIVPCADCRGQGEVISAPCDDCRGAKVLQGQKVITINIDPGMSQDQKVVLREEADQEPGVTPGDLVFVIHELEHPLFKRHGANLVMKKTVTLREALCGFTFTIKHLDDRILVVKNQPGEVIRPGLSKCIRGEGMPRHRQIFNKGDLFIDFEIEYPPSGSLSADAIAQLSAILPGPAPQHIPAGEEVEEVRLDDVTISREEALKKEPKKRTGEAYEEDDEEGAEHAHPGVRCAQQ